MNMESKKAFVDACNNIDGVDFIKASLLYLSGVSGKDELNEFVNIFGGVSKIKTIEESVDLKSLCVLLRDKVYDILIANGDVPENSYINLYSYYAVCSLEEDVRYTAYEQFIDQHVLSKDISDMERMYLIVLRFFASMANSRKNAFEVFMSSTLRLNLIDVGSVEFSKTVSNFLNDSTIEFEDVLAILFKAYDKDFYFSLDKTERRSIFNWSLHSIWLAQKCFNHPEWAKLYPSWKAVLYEHIERNECDEAMYVQFFVYHVMGNSFQEQSSWKIFNDEIEKPASEYYKKWQEKAKMPKCKAKQSGGKKIMGFLQDRLVQNSPFKVQYSIWKTLVNNQEFMDKYEMRLYLMSYFEKSINEGKCIDMVEGLGIPIFDGSIPFYKDEVYHNHLEKALHIRNQIISDGVDILISTNSGYDICDFLLVSRAAPMQVYWSHGNFEYDIEGIDKRISHISEYSHMKQSDYKVCHFEYKTDDMFTKPDEEAYKQKASIVRAKFAPDVVILGSIGRLIKLDNYEYLGAVAKIMQECENTIYLACGTGNEDSVRAKAIESGIPMDRFFFEGYVDPHVYGYVIDVYLNTFPERSGEALNEFLAKDGNKYEVSLEN